MMICRHITHLSGINRCSGGVTMMMHPADLTILASAVATFICTLWVIRGFLASRRTKQTLPLKTHFRFLGQPNGAGDRIAEVRVIINNTTKNRIALGPMDFTARGVDKDDCVECESGVRFLKFPIPIVRKRPMLPDMWAESYIDRGQRILYKGMFVVPRNIAWVNIVIYFDAEDPNVDFYVPETSFPLK